MPDDPMETDVEKIARDENATVSDLRKASDALKSKIEKAKARNEMPLNSGLGNPEWDQRAADGHLDIHDDE